MVGSEGIFLVGGFKGISAISVCDIAVFGLMAITFTEFTGLVICESLKVIRCGLGAEIVTAQVRDLPRTGIPLPDSDYKTYTYNEI